MKHISRVVGAGLLTLNALAALILPSVMSAQAAWPESPISIVVGWPPGGGTDILARGLSKPLSKILGQPVIVQNQPGAGGVVGASNTAKAKSDGYTLLFAADAELTIAPVVKKLENFDPIQNLAPISLVSSGPFMIVANPKFPPNTLRDLVSYAKERPGTVNYGSFGYGTVGHMLGEYFKSIAGIDTVHIPYQGSAPAMVDLVGGRIQYAFFSPMAVLNMIKAGRLKAIAMLSPQRLEAAMAVPTSAEEGFPGFEGGPKFGLLAPAGTPKPVIDRIHASVEQALAAPETRKFFSEQGHVPIGSTPGEYGNFIKTQTEQWRKLVADVGIEQQN
jgi:tripartite-type tricarboxylate transporter receptor subunit TctC